MFRSLRTPAIASTLFLVGLFGISDRALGADGTYTKVKAVEKGNSQAGVSGGITTHAEFRIEDSPAEPIDDPKAELSYDAHADVKLFGGSLRVLGLTAEAHSKPKEFTDGVTAVTNNLEPQEKNATVRLVIGGMTVSSQTALTISKKFTSGGDSDAEDDLKKLDRESYEAEQKKKKQEKQDVPVHALEKSFVWWVGPVPITLEAAVGSSFEGEIELEATYPVRGTAAFSYWSQGSLDAYFNVPLLRVGVKGTLQLLKNRLEGNLFLGMTGVDGNIRLIQEAARIFVDAYIDRTAVKWVKKSKGWISWYVPKTYWKKVASARLVDYSYGKIETTLCEFGFDFAPAAVSEETAEDTVEAEVVAGS